MRKALLLPTALLLFVLSALMVDPLNTLKPRTAGAGFRVPLYIYDHLLLLFPGMREVTADAIYMQMCYFVGAGGFERERARKTFEPEWVKTIEDFYTIHRLEPYFFDPYYMEASSIAWQVKDRGTLVRAVNRNLEFGLGKCEDWRIPFFLGFNYFYFLKDRKKGAEFIAMAAKMEGAPSYLPLLAGRLYAETGSLDIAIAVTEEQLKASKPGKVREELEDRLTALRTLKALSTAVEEYRRKFRACPSRLEELVEKGLIDYIPADPYGGEFYIRRDCSVWTTSDLRYQ